MNKDKHCIDCGKLCRGTRCRKCHMIKDGRLKQLMTGGKNKNA